MSVCVNVRTAEKLEPKKIFDEFVKRGERIIITSDEFPSLKLGTVNEALRGIEINEEDDGYEVRICTFSNESDLKLYVTAVSVMMSMTNSKAYYENDDEDEITNPEERFGDNWIHEQLESSFSVNCILSKYHGKPVIMNGLFFPFCFGPLTMSIFDINPSNPDFNDMIKVQNYFSRIQWDFSNKKDTSSRLMIQNKNDEKDRSLSVSMICAKGGEVQEFDYVSYADLVCLMDMDTHEMSLIRMKDFCMIIPKDIFFFMDDYQHAKDEDASITYEMFKEMQKRAKLYKVDDPHYKPTYLGNGYDEHQRTYVLMWNPAISSTKMDEFVKYIPHIMTSGFNWSIYEHEHARKDDRFVIVRCGEGNTGIVMSGIFLSNPYQGDDWAGKSKKRYYMDLEPNFIANPEKADIITTDELQKAIPDFNWNGGHSGRLLTLEQAEKLDNLMAVYLKQYSNNLDGITVNGYSLPNFYESQTDY